MSHTHTHTYTKKEHHAVTDLSPDLSDPLYINLLVLFFCFFFSCSFTIFILFMFLFPPHFLFSLIFYIETRRKQLKSSGVRYTHQTGIYSLESIYDVYASWTSTCIGHYLKRYKIPHIKIKAKSCWVVHLYRTCFFLDVHFSLKMVDTFQVLAFSLYIDWIDHLIVLRSVWREKNKFKHAQRTAQ